MESKPASVCFKTNSSSSNYSPYIEIDPVPSPFNKINFFLFFLFYINKIPSLYHKVFYDSMENGSFVSSWFSELDKFSCTELSKIFCWSGSHISKKLHLYSSCLILINCYIKKNNWIIYISNLPCHLIN